MSKLEDEWSEATPVPAAVQDEWNAAAPVAPTTRTWGQAATEGITNIPSSAIEYGKNIVQPFLHPIDTAKNLADIAIGGIGRGAEKVFPGSEDLAPEQKAKFDALRQMLAQRYGGAENIKNTLATDPVGVGADVSSVLTGGGALTARMPGMLGKTGEVVAAAGRVMEPVNAVKQTIGGARNLIPGSLPTGLYESALKPGAPTKRFTREQQLEALQAGLDAGIFPTAKGAEKIDTIITALNDQIMGKIEEGTRAGSTIKTADIVKRLDGVEEYFGRLPLSKKYIEQINEVRQGTLDKGNTLTLAEAQKTKQAIYNILKDSYGELSTATKEANKGIARGIKEEIVSIFPEIKSLNTQEALMLRLEPLIEKAAARLNKRDIMGIGTPIAGIAGATAMGPQAGVAAFLTKAILEHPNVKTYIAIALNKAKKGGLGPGFVDQRLTAYWAGKMGGQEQANAEPFAF